MYTPIVLFAFAGFGATAENVMAPSWLTDYTQARKQGAMDKKPVAVFVASGQEGWDKLVRNGSLVKEQKKILGASYVCVYLDVATEDGKRVARSLEIGSNVGLVISDHSGKFMAFHHEGDLDGRALTTYLQRYSDAERTVVRTDTNPGNETRSYYSPVPATLPARSYAPVRSC